jgi:hypothetical protein
MDKATISVSSSIARQYNSLPEKDQLKIQAVMSAWMNETGRISTDELIRIVSLISEIRTSEEEITKLRLFNTMDMISDRAAERGLTPEILEELLADES